MADSRSASSRSEQVPQKVQIADACNPVVLCMKRQLVPSRGKLQQGTLEHTSVLRECSRFLCKHVQEFYLYRTNPIMYCQWNV